MRKAVFRPYQEPVVLGVPVRPQLENRAVDGWNRPPWGGRSIGVLGGLGLVGVVEAIEPGALRSRVGNLQHGVEWQLVLCGELPLLHVRGTKARIKPKELGQSRVAQRIQRKATGEMTEARN